MVFAFFLRRHSVFQELISQKISFFREFFCFWEIILALWKGGRLEKCLNWCLDITYFRFVFIDFLIEWY